MSYSYLSLLIESPVSMMRNVLNYNLQANHKPKKDTPKQVL